MRSSIGVALAALASSAAIAQLPNPADADLVVIDQAVIVRDAVGVQVAFVARNTGARAVGEFLMARCALYSRGQLVTVLMGAIGRIGAGAQKPGVTDYQTGLSTTPDKADCVPAIP
jgi:hypothetical protein